MSEECKEILLVILAIAGIILFIWALNMLSFYVKARILQDAVNTIL